MSQKSKALILVNTGTPDKPTVPAVRRYLFQFLNDKRIIDIPWLLRKLLVNLIIVPFRAPKSTKLYQRLWTKHGSPLLIHLEALTKKVEQIIGDEFDVYGAMRYGNPSFRKLFRELEYEGYNEIVIMPLYPQYATSTTESVADIINEILPKWKNKPVIHFVRQFYNHAAFIQAFKKRIAAYEPENYDHVIFSYHGLPLRQIDKMHPGIKSETCPCTEDLPVHGQYCYKATTYHTTRLLARELNLAEEHYTTSYQSRLSKNWLRPFTDETLISLAKAGKKRILIAAPAFVADCLETTIELGHEYKLLFEQHGGEKLEMVESLNDSDDWAKAISMIIKK
ncbi:Ferrochelatase [Salinivirga cyanobacteriivorans]|uniref:Ferrochelatase n=1 Tax=Salinivirga cyanobacteriivorans TaxID=1307839 RepID=A0A0S2I4B6_9BACT|nr:ferrochelatase [Salinivirga cyanobacteriivorans]ALO17169.1 Ferrochelatase [Salinivirga cyanobacteriivorans]